MSAGSYARCARVQADLFCALGELSEAFPHPFGSLIVRVIKGPLQCIVNRPTSFYTLDAPGLDCITGRDFSERGTTSKLVCVSSCTQKRTLAEATLTRGPGGTQALAAPPHPAAAVQLGPSPSGSAAVGRSTPEEPRLNRRSQRKTQIRIQRKEISKCDGFRWCYCSVRRCAFFSETRRPTPAGRAERTVARKVGSPRKPILLTWMKIGF